MQTISKFIDTIKHDCSDSIFAEAVTMAARALFEADEDAADTAENDSADTAGEGSEDDVDAMLADDDNVENGDNADAANSDANVDDRSSIPQPNGKETAETVNIEPKPAMPPEEIVKKFVATGAVRKAQEDMVQTKNDSLEEFAKKIAASLAKFCVDNQIPTLDPDGSGKKIAIALAKRYGQAR